MGWDQLGLVVGALMGVVTVAQAADPEVLRPRVPSDQIESARAVTNPLPSTPDMLGRGKALFEGKAFCRACHGLEGRGWAWIWTILPSRARYREILLTGCGNRRGRMESYCGF